jgi:hypothetical protein
MPVVYDQLRGLAAKNAGAANADHPARYPCLPPLISTPTPALGRSWLRFINPCPVEKSLRKTEPPSTCSREALRVERRSEEVKG